MPKMKVERHGEKTAMLFIFALASNILALLAALTVVLLLVFLANCGASRRDRAVMAAVSAVSLAIPVAGLWLCFNPDGLAIAVGVGLLSLPCYAAVARYAIKVIEVAVRP